MFLFIQHVDLESSILTLGVFTVLAAYVLSKTYEKASHSFFFWQLRIVLLIYAMLGTGCHRVQGRFRESNLGDREASRQRADEGQGRVKGQEERSSSQAHQQCSGRSSVGSLHPLHQRWFVPLHCHALTTSRPPPSELTSHICSVSGSVHLHDVLLVQELFASNELRLFHDGRFCHSVHDQLINVKISRVVSLSSRRSGRIHWTVTNPEEQWCRGSCQCFVASGDTTQCLGHRLQTLGVSVEATRCCLLDQSRSLGA